MTYFNEIEPFCIDWLRNQFGDVDERDIREITVPADALRQHYFAGLGGWEWALRLAGWPEDQEVWTGSCPCQPFSVAGKRQADSDERDLWPAFFRLISIARPAVILGEQVSGAIAYGWLDRICDDLEGIGYAVGATVLPACGVGAPHIRQRLYWVALASGERLERERLQLRAWEPREALLEAGWGSEARASAAGFCRACGASIPHRDGEARCTRCVGYASSARGRGHAGAILSPQEEAWRRLRRQLDESFPPSVPCSPMGDAYCPRPQGRSECGLGPYELSPWTAGVAYVHCTDGKMRPVESASQCMANGISLALDRLRNCSHEKEAVIHAAQSTGLRNEILWSLRDGNDPTEIWYSIGGCLGLSQATILLAVLCEYSRELGGVFHSTSTSREQVREIALRALQAQGQAACSPQRRELAEQFAEQLTDTLSKLPQVDALIRALAPFNGHPLTEKFSERAALLKGCGNAIVPQVAATFIQAVMEAA